MRIERILRPWESEDADPRLELRRGAAASQRYLDVEDAPLADDLVFDDFRSTGSDDWGLADESRGERVAPATGRR